MAPKKKGSKKQADDDWEAELGEAVPPANGDYSIDTSAVATTPQENGDDDGQMGGGLLAALKKNRNKKAKKGKVLDNDFVEGEDPTAAPDTDGNNFSNKQPEEATFDDNDDDDDDDGDDGDDVFAGNAKKGKGGATGKAAETTTKEETKDTEDAGDEDGVGKVKSKKEKEKEKKGTREAAKEGTGCEKESDWSSSCSGG